MPEHTHKHQHGHGKPAGDPPDTTLKVTIQSVCNANPKSAKLGGTTGMDQIQWQATANNSYDLHLPGGVFQNQANAFTLTITGTGWQPSTPLQLAANAPATTDTNYIYQNGSNCPGDTGDDPPEVIIQS